MRAGLLSQAVVLIFALSAVAKVSSSNDFIKPQLIERIEQLAQDSKNQPKDFIWKSLSRLEADMSSLRKENIRQQEDDEVYIETVMMVLKEIPRRKDFKKESCADYRNKILSQYNPEHDSKPSPAVDKGLEVLKIFCD